MTHVMNPLVLCDDAPGPPAYGLISRSVLTGGDIQQEVPRAPAGVQFGNG